MNLIKIIIDKQFIRNRETKSIVNNFKSIDSKKIEAIIVVWLIYECFLIMV